MYRLFTKLLFVFPVNSWKHTLHYCSLNRIVCSSIWTVVSNFSALQIGSLDAMSRANILSFKCLFILYFPENYDCCANCKIKTNFVTI